MECPLKITHDRMSFVNPSLTICLSAGYVHGRLTEVSKLGPRSQFGNDLEIALGISPHVQPGRPVVAPEGEESIALCDAQSKGTSKSSNSIDFSVCSKLFESELE